MNNKQQQGMSNQVPFLQVSWQSLESANCLRHHQFLSQSAKPLTTKLPSKIEERPEELPELLSQEHESCLPACRLPPQSTNHAPRFCGHVTKTNIARAYLQVIPLPLSKLKYINLKLPIKSDQITYHLCIDITVVATILWFFLR